MIDAIRKELAKEDEAYATMPDEQLAKKVAGLVCYALDMKLTFDGIREALAEIDGVPETVYGSVTTVDEFGKKHTESSYDDEVAIWLLHNAEEVELLREERQHA